MKHQVSDFGAKVKSFKEKTDFLGFSAIKNVYTSIEVLYLYTHNFEITYN